MRRVNVIRRDVVPSRSAPTDTGRAFVAAIALKGVYDPTKPVRSLDQLTQAYGGRQSWSVLYDWADTFFSEGGSELIVSPVAGPAAAKASLNIAGSTTGTALTLTAKSVGDWANGATGGLSVQVVQGPSGASYRQLVVLLNGVEVERSLEFTANTDAPAALANSSYVTITLGAGTGLIAVAAAANLTGGNLDRSNITQTQVDAALALMTRDAGPGQVAAPDWQTSQSHASLRAHAAANNRYALPDAPDGSTKSALQTLGHAGQADVNAIPSNAVLQPWLTIAGISGGAPRSVPASAFVAAHCATTDATAGPSQAPAGAQYGGAVSSTVLGVKATWTDTDQADLEAAGVATLISRYGQVVLDTNRTAVNPLGADSEWLQAGVSRYMMSITGRIDSDSNLFAHRRITGKVIAEFDTRLTGEFALDEQRDWLLLKAGEAPGSSFAVDTGPTINTDASIQAGNLVAACAFRPAPGADFVTIYLTAVGVADQVAA